VTFRNEDLREGNMHRIKAKDLYLEERLAWYDKWLPEGGIPTSSKVIPIRESLTALHQVGLRM
jgi:hypothetical protein